MTSPAAPRRRFRFRFALALLALSGLGAAGAHAAVSEADRADVARIETYMNAIQTLEARFNQVSPDGSVSEGRVLLRRPGKMRFEYDPPTPILLVADGTFMIFHDKSLKQTTHIPLSTTPLAFLVQEKLDFSGSAAIERVERSPGAIRLTAYDPKKPKEGKITLVFADQPLQLKQWVVQDANGQQTTVALSQMQTNIPLKSDLFYFVDMSPR